jgi:ppGpp synthetase/RelA/SpoT-type nucleotidyltranferase
MSIIENLRSEYESKHGLYAEFLEEIKHQLNVLLDHQDILKTAEISSRVKDFDSIVHNINNYKFDPKIPDRLDLITDLTGIRISLLFKRSIKPICDSIEKQFEMKEKKYIFYSDDQFGYESVHYEIKLKKGCSSHDKYDKFNNLIAEIQVRTFAQHLWAAASHYLHYKERKDAGKPLQRPLSRISALLELVDEEYDRLLTLKEEYQKNADINDSTETLNVDLIERIIREEFPTEKGFAIDENMSAILEDLFLFEIKTVKDFRLLLNKHKAKALEHQEVGFNIMRDHIGAKGQITFSIHGIIKKILKLEFDKKDGFAFFEKISRLPEGTVEKLISTMKKKEQE